MPLRLRLPLVLLLLVLLVLLLVLVLLLLVQFQSLFASLPVRRLQMQGTPKSPSKTKGKRGAQDPLLPVIRMVTGRCRVHCTRSTAQSRYWGAPFLRPPPQTTKERKEGRKKETERQGKEKEEGCHASTLHNTDLCVCVCVISVRIAEHHTLTPNDTDTEHAFACALAVTITSFHSCLSNTARHSAQRATADACTCGKTPTRQQSCVQTLMWLCELMP